MGSELTPDDVAAAAEFVHGALVPGADRDWSVQAGTLEWDVRRTVEHAAGAVTGYAISLGSGTTSFLGMRVRAYEDAENWRVLRMVPTAGKLLATVAAAVPDDARAYHPAGMADRTGFLAMACDELLVHGWDVAQTLGLSFDADATIAAKTVARLFPWAPDTSDPWDTLLWTNGRRSIAGLADVASDWGWQCAPLSEWDGEVRRTTVRPSSYAWDPTTTRWLPSDAKV